MLGSDKRKEFEFEIQTFQYLVSKCEDFIEASKIHSEYYSITIAAIVTLGVSQFCIGQLKGSPVSLEFSIPIHFPACASSRSSIFYLCIGRSSS
jgi:hypothetical protein